MHHTFKPTLYRWKPEGWDNFGDALSQPIVERILGKKVEISLPHHQKRLLTLGSIIHYAKNGDVIWGTGFLTGRFPVEITELDVRAVRGPLTRDILLARNIECPPIYGDPAQLLPKLFPEFKPNPIRDYIVIPHAYETPIYSSNPHVVSSKSPWKQMIQKITESKFVISSSLHGIIVAEAFDIPSRMLLIKEEPQFFKFQDYYEATGRKHFQYAETIEEALQLGGEEQPSHYNPQPLLNAFPVEYFE